MELLKPWKLHKVSPTIPYFSAITQKSGLQGMPDLNVVQKE